MRILRWLLGILGALVAALALGVGGLAIWARTAAGQRWILTRALELAQPHTGRLSVARLQTDLGSRLRLEDVRLQDDVGRELLGLDHLDAAFTLDLLARRVTVHRLDIDGLRGDLAVTDAGLDLAALWADPDRAPAPSAPYDGLGVDLEVDALDVQGRYLTVRVGEQVWALVEPRLRGGVWLVGDQILVQDLSLDAAATVPDLGALDLRADLSYDAEYIMFKRLDLNLGPQHAALTGGWGPRPGAPPAWAVQLVALHLAPERLPWPVPVRGVFDVQGELTGLLDAPQVTLEITTPGGPVQIAAGLDLRPARATWTADVAAHPVALHTFLPDLDPTVLDVHLAATGAGLRWPEDLDATGTLDGTALVLPVLGSAALRGQIALAEGVLTLRGLEASTPTGRLGADLRVDVPAERGAATVTALDVNLADLARFGVRGLGGTARFVGTVEGSWSAAAPSARADGVLSGSRLRVQQAATVATLAGPVEIRWADDAVRWVAALRAGGVAAGGATAERLSLRSRGRASAAGVSSAEGVALATAVQAGALAGDRGAARLSLQGDRLLASVDLTDAERTVVGVDAAGDLGTGRVTLPRLVLSPQPDQVWVGQGTPGFVLASDGVDDLQVAIASGGASVAVAGNLHTQGEVALALSAVDLPLELIAGLVPGLAGYGGLIHLSGAAGGSVHQLTLVADGGVAGLIVPGALHGVDAQVRVDGREGRVTVDASAATQAPDPQVLATLQGSLPVRLDLGDLGLRVDQPLDLTLDVPASTSAAWNAVLDAAQLPRGRGGARLALSGTPQAPAARLVATVEVPSAYTQELWTGLDLDAASAGERLTVSAALRQGETERAALSGGASSRLDQVAASLLGTGPALVLSDPTAWLDALDLTLTPTDLTVQSLAAYTTIPRDLHGRFEGALHLRGSPRAPVLDGALRLDRARLGQREVSPVSLTVQPSPGGYDLRADLGFGAEGDLLVAAHVPLDLAAPGPPASQLQTPGLKVEIAGAGVPLDVVSALWPGMQAASGALVVAGSVGGSLAAPVPDLRATLQDASFELEATGVAYDQVGFALILTPTAAALDGLHLRTRSAGSKASDRTQGTLDAALHAALQGTTLGDWSGQITFDRPLLSDTPDTLLRLSTGAVQLRGTPPAIVVDGTLAVEEARVRLDDRFFSGRGDRTLPPWLRVHRGVPRVDAALEEDTGLPDWLELTFGIDLARNVFLHAQLPLEASLGQVLGAFATVTLDAQVDGQLRIGARDGQLSVEGQVLPLRGTTALFGRPFEIRDDSTISFTGNDFASPILDLHAVYDTRTYGLVEAHITGMPDAMTVELSSDDYPSQDDVISLLLVGKPAAEVTAGEAMGDSASSAALALVLATLGQELGDQGAQAAAMFITPDLLVLGADTARVGKRIGNRVFVVVDLDNTADNIKTSYLLLTIEVALGGPWEAEFVHGTAGEDTLGVNWTRRY